MGRKIKVIKIQDNALLRLRELKEKHKKNYVRLDVKGGGCAGFNYEWSFDDEDRIDDVIVDDILLISRDYELYLMGMDLDYNYDHSLIDPDEQLCFQYGINYNHLIKIV